MKPLQSFSRKVYSIVIAISILIEVMAVAVNSVSAQAQPTPSDDQVNVVASQIYCPVCQNITLDVCGTAACAQWRELIHEKLAQGETPAQIKNYFAQQYGDRVLAVPPRTGLNWLLYLLPAFILLAALILSVQFIHSHRVAPANSVSEVDEPTKEDRHE